jgi:hypothetical protein
MILVSGSSVTSVLAEKQDRFLLRDGEERIRDLGRIREGRNLQVYSPALGRDPRIVDGRLRDRSRSCLSSPVPIAAAAGLDEPSAERQQQREADGGLAGRSHP